MSDTGAETLSSLILRVDKLARRIVDRLDVPNACAHEFRCALRATCARHAVAEMALGSLAAHDLVHAARRLMTAPPVAMVLTDAHISTFLFGAWSTVETLVYSTNAIGFAVAPEVFRSVHSSEALRRVCPNDVFGSKPQPGYALHFPALRATLLQHETDLRVIEAQHSVSKHRKHVMAGGEIDLSFVTAVAPELRDIVRHLAMSQFSMKNVMLDPDPKSSLDERQQMHPVSLFDAAGAWRRAIHDALRALCRDIEALAGPDAAP